MILPSHIAKGFWEAAPEYRLGWDCNQKVFMVLGLARIRAVGTPEDPKTYRSWWDFRYEIDPKTGQEKLVKFDVGPIFTKNGYPGCDWDPLQVIPVREFSYTEAEVLSGFALKDFKRRLKPAHVIAKQSVDAQKQKGLDLYHKIQEINYESKHVAKFSSKGKYDKPPMIAKKFQKKSLAHQRAVWLREKASGKAFWENRFVTKKAKNGI